MENVPELYNFDQRNRYSKRKISEKSVVIFKKMGNDHHSSQRTAHISIITRTVQLWKKVWYRATSSMPFFKNTNIDDFKH